MKKSLFIIFLIGLFFCRLPGVFAQSNQTVSNGATIKAVGLNAGCNYSWSNSDASIGLAASGTGSIPSFTAINTGTSPVTATIIARPAANGFAYLGNADDETITVIDASTNKFVKNITVGIGNKAVAISPDQRKAYVSILKSGSGSGLAVIDIATNTVVLTMDEAENYANLLISPDGSKLYATFPDSKGDGNLTVFNTSDLSKISNTDFNSSTTFTILSPDGNLLYVGNAVTGTGSVDIFNMATNKITGHIAVDGSPVQAAMTADGSHLYVTCELTNTVCVINTATNKTEARIPIGQGAGAYGIAVSKDGSQVYVTMSNYNTIAVINGITNTLMPQIVVGLNPVGLCVTPDGNFLYSENESSNNVSVIDTKTDKVVTTIPAGNFPNTTGNFISARIGCDDITYTITVNPSPFITPGAVSGTINACLASASASPAIQQFTVSGNYLTANVTATAPIGFEVSLNSTTGYSTSLTLTPSNGILGNTTIYVRSSATAPAGNISGNVILSSDGAADQPEAVSGIVSTIPTVNTPEPQTLLTGTTTAPINITGTAASYIWMNDTPGIGLAENGTGDIPAFTAVNNTLNPITAIITIIPVNGTNCEGTAVTFTITVRPSNSMFNFSSIPNAFTPNGDGTNDTWVIPKLEYYQAANVNVFNRWGQKVFSSVGYPVAWNGTYEGKALPTGTYYFIIDLKNTQPVYAGWVAIVR